MRCAAALLIACMGAGCGGTSAADAEPSVLRVAAVHGLDRLTPSADLSGSTAYALVLAFDPGDQHVALVERVGATLRVRPISTVDPALLAQSASYDGLTRAAAVDDGQIELEFADDETAALVASRLDYLGFALGPYRVEDPMPRDGVLRLERQSGEGADVIELVSMGENEQWRRLLARDVGAVPISPAAYRDRYAGLRGLRVVEYATPTVGVGVFNARALDRDEREAVSGAIDRATLARVMCPSSGCARVAEAPVGSRVELPDLIRILVMRDSEVLVRAARAMRLQLLEQGVDVEIAVVDLQEFIVRANAGEFDLILVPRSLENSWLEHTLAQFQALSGYNPEGRDIAADVPAMQLSAWREFAVVDAAYCGGQPESYGSWRWLADLYPCEAE